MRLTVKIKKATDGRMELDVLELPSLDVTVQRVGEIPEAVRTAAAKETGISKDDIRIDVGY